MCIYFYNDYISSLECATLKLSVISEYRMEKDVKGKWPFPELSSSQEGCPEMQNNPVRVVILWLEIWSQELAV